MEIQGIVIDITSGQVSHVPEFEKLRELQVGLSYGGYLTPAKDGHHDLGATFDRSACIEISASAHYHNINLLPCELASLFSDPEVYGARVSRRASTPDRNPVCGKVDENIFVLGALGARGLTLAPLLGDMLAAQIMGTPVTQGLDIQRGLEPRRFRLR